MRTTTLLFFKRVYKWYLTGKIVQYTEVKKVIWVKVKRSQIHHYPIVHRAAPGMSPVFSPLTYLTHLTFLTHLTKN
jgi:hypothetical protein